MEQEYDNVQRLWQSFHIRDVDALDDALQSFCILFAYHSGKIENEKIDYHDVREIFENGRVLNYSGDIQTLLEQHNQKLCHDFLRERIVAKEPLTLALIREIHGILTADTYDEKRYIARGERPGAFKKHDYVTGIHEVGYPPEQVEDALTELLDEISSHESDKDPLLTAAYFHARFETIHPFADGNGRVGRTLMNYYLMSRDYPPVIIHDEDKKAYYDALEQYDADENIHPLRRFIMAQAIKTWDRQMERTMGRQPDRKGLKDFMCDQK